MRCLLSADDAIHTFVEMGSRLDTAYVVYYEAPQNIGDGEIEIWYGRVGDGNYTLETATAVLHQFAEFERAGFAWRCGSVAALTTPLVVHAELTIYKTI